MPVLLSFNKYEAHVNVEEGLNEWLIISRLGMEVRKDENFSEWYSQVG